MNEIQIIIEQGLFQIVKKVLYLSKEFDDDDYFHCGEDYPDEKVQWIVDKLTNNKK